MTPAHGDEHEVRVPRAALIAGAALLPGIIVLFFDALEGFVGDIGGPSGGLPVTLWIFVLYVVVWLPGGAVLWGWSVRPAQDGAIAGAVAATPSLLFVLPNVPEYGVTLLIVWSAIATILVGTGAVAGAIAGLMKRARPPAGQRQT